MPKFNFNTKTNPMLRGALKALRSPIGGGLAAAGLPVVQFSAVRETMGQRRADRANDFSVRRAAAFEVPQPPAAVAPDSAVGGGDFAEAEQPFDVGAAIAALLGGGEGGGGPVVGGGGFDLGGALAALGGGPDRGTYLRPFEEAEARAREAGGAATGTIASTYAALRDQLAAGGQQADAVAQRVAAEQAARQQQAAQQVGAANAATQTDLAAQGGQNLVGSLMGGLQAAGGQQQANLAAQAARQNALSAEQAANTRASTAGRVEDAKLGEANALGQTQNNLNAVLNQIGIGRAGAERQYTNDVQQFAQRRAAIQFEAQEAQQRAAAAAAAAARSADREARSIAKDRAAEERRRAADLEKEGKRIEQAENKARQEKIVADRDQFISSFPHWQKVSPKHFEYFQGLINDPEVARGKPEEAVQKALARIYGDAGQNFGGLIPKANPTALEEWVRLYFGVPKAAAPTADTRRYGA